MLLYTSILYNKTTYKNNMKVVFLGTSSMVPTKQRNVQGTYLDYEGTGMLFDCGEGTQRQMNIAGINRNKIQHVFITHWHGDHVSGLIGLIQTIGCKEKNKSLTIYGPKGSQKYVNHILKSCHFELNIQINVIEATKQEQTILQKENYHIQTTYVNHTVPCIAYKFIEKDRLKIIKKKLKQHNIAPSPKIADLKKGKDITIQNKTIKSKNVTKNVPGRILTIILDTKYTKDLATFAKNSDILICEATYKHELLEKAREYKHMTATQAATIAKNSNSKKLYLTHFSQRYKKEKELEQEAQEIFKNTTAAKDFLTITLPKKK